MAPSPTPIYHITHVANLPQILANDGLHCCTELRARQQNFTTIAYGHIQDRRSRCPVPLVPGGCLHDYVPFYFAPRSPMLYAIDKGIVPGYQGGQRPVVHLVTTAQAIAAADLEFVFTNGHSTVALSNFYKDLADLDRVDWPVMSSTWWNDTQQHPDRKRRRQAEFLVHRLLSWTFVHEIGVIDQRVQQHVLAILTTAPHRPQVTVQRRWYY